MENIQKIKSVLVSQEPDFVKYELVKSYLGTPLEEEVLYAYFFESKSNDDYFKFLVAKEEKISPNLLEQLKKHQSILVMIGAFSNRFDKNFIK